MSETIGDRIKQARLEQKLTQQQLAQKCGVKRAAVSQWENGESKSPTAENVMLIAKALGRSQKWLITGEHERPRMTIVAEPDTSYEADPFISLMRGLSETERAVVLELLSRYRKIMAEASAQLDGLWKDAQGKTARQRMLEKGNTPL